MFGVYLIISFILQQTKLYKNRLIAFYPHKWSVRLFWKPPYAIGKKFKLSKHIDFIIKIYDIAALNINGYMDQINEA